MTYEDHTTLKELDSPLRDSGHHQHARWRGAEPVRIQGPPMAHNEPYTFAGAEPVTQYGLTIQTGHVYGHRFPISLFTPDLWCIKNKH
jgi:hypothetical protein